MKIFIQIFVRDFSWQPPFDGNEDAEVVFEKSKIEEKLHPPLEDLFTAKLFTPAAEELQSSK